MDTKLHNSPETFDNVRAFLMNNFVGTLSTVGPDNSPYGSVMYYTVGTDLTIRFLTKKDTTKSQNIQHNPKVSFVVFEAHSQTVVTVEGEAIDITDTEEASPIFSELIKIVENNSESGIPPISTLIDAGRYVAYSIKPTEIRMANFSRPNDGGYDQFEVLRFE